MTQSLLVPDNLSNGSPPQVDIYTDGGCDPNPGPGGWAAIIRWDEQPRKHSRERQGAARTWTKICPKCNSLTRRLRKGRDDAICSD